MGFVARTRALPAWLRYGATSAALLAAFAARATFEPYLATFPFLLFIPVVLLAALFFSRATGIYGSVASAWLATYFFEPIGHFWVDHVADVIKIGVYALLTTGSAVVIESLHDAYARVALAERQKALLLQELSHRVSNHFASLASLVRLKAAAVGDPAARSALEGIIEQIRVFARVHDRFKLVGDDILVDGDAFLGGLCADLRSTLGVLMPIAIDCRIAPVQLALGQAVPLGLIVNELVTNALKHAFPDGRAGTVTVSLAREGVRGILTVEDDGVGVDGAATPQGLGHKLVPALTKQLDGEVAIETRSPGTRVRVRFALDRTTPA